jgi:KaiC/GvpD/RAD55 family RecA-like ATPase
MVPKSKKKKVSKLYTPERISTGIKGLDGLVEGGFLKGSSILVSGGTGTGKTIFCLQFLFEGLKNGESCVYITLEESARDIIEDALSLGIDLRKYEKKGKFRIVEHNIFSSTNIDFFAVDKIKASRVVIDPFSLLALSIEDKPIIRQRLYETIKMLKEKGVTMVITSEVANNSESKFSRHCIEEFVVDGLIKLEMDIVGAEIHRSINLVKMRKTNMRGGRYSIEISKGGIKIIE